MLKSLCIPLRKIASRVHYSNRNLKPHKFIPTPIKTTVPETSLPPPTKIDQETVEHLERLSLVGFGNEKAIQIVEDAIRFADQILQVDTEDVKPLITVLEDESLYLREDKPELDVTKSELMSYPQVSEENYFLTPVGNQDYIPEEKVTANQAVASEKVCRN